MWLSTQSLDTEGPGSSSSSAAYCVALGESLNLSELPLPHCLNVHNFAITFAGLLRR